MKFQCVCYGCYMDHRPYPAVGKGLDGFPFRGLEGQVVHVVVYGYVVSVGEIVFEEGLVEDCGVCVVEMASECGD